MKSTSYLKALFCSSLGLLSLMGVSLPRPVDRRKVSALVMSQSSFTYFSAEQQNLQFLMNRHTLQGEPVSVSAGLWHRTTLIKWTSTEKTNDVENNNLPAWLNHIK